MCAVKIAHLSDLHFCRTKEHEVWEEVRNFLNDTVKPDAVLITGDLTDNAERDEFDYAKECLSTLKAKGDKEYTSRRPLPAILSWEKKTANPVGTSG